MCRRRSSPADTPRARPLRNAAFALALGLLLGPGARAGLPDGKQKGEARPTDPGPVTEARLRAVAAVVGQVGPRNPGERAALLAAGRSAWGREADGAGAELWLDRGRTSAVAAAQLVGVRNATTAAAMRVAGMQLL